MQLGHMRDVLNLLDFTNSKICLTQVQRKQNALVRAEKARHALLEYCLIENSAKPILVGIPGMEVAGLGLRPRPGSGKCSRTSFGISLSSTIFPKIIQPTLADFLLRLKCAGRECPIL
jgi:hypothetical protein